MRRTLIGVAAIVTFVGGALLGGVAKATPPSGLTVEPLAAGLAHDIKGALKPVKDRGDSQVIVAQITIDPGGTTGWHTHPGVVIVVVDSGAVTLYDGADRTCTGTTYGSGQVFVDKGHGHVHLARNEGNTPVVLTATFLEVPPGTPPLLDAEDPGNCSF